MGVEGGMDAVAQLTDRLTEWSERLLVKGLAKTDAKDVDELHALCDEARELDMGFLASLLEQLAEAGARYVRDSRADVEELVHRYFYLCQYVSMAETGAEENQP